MAELDHVLAAAGWSGHLVRFGPSWPGCGAAAGEALPAWLDPGAVEASARRSGLGEAHRAELRAGLALFDAVPALRPLAAHARWLVQAGVALPGPGGWPMIGREVHPAGPLFWAYIVLAGVDDRVAANRARGMAEADTLPMFQDLGRWMDEYRRSRGHAGFDRMGWLWLHLQGRLVEIGRLQHGPDIWRSPVRVLRHRRDRRVAMIMEPGQRLRADGRHQGVARSSDAPDGYTTALAVDGDGWRGHPVDARGRAVREPAVFPAADWEQVLASGDPVWFVHIPAGAPLDPAACRDSLVRAAALMPRWYPEHGARAFISISWMFDAQLADHLPPDANLVRFLRGFHLHPSHDVTGDQIRERVLGSTAVDIAAFQPANSLQRAVVGHLRSGGIWCQSGAVLLADEAATAFTG